MSLLVRGSQDLQDVKLGLTAHVDQSIASATGASQTVVAANANRRELVIYNYSGNDWWINPTGGTAVANTAGNIKVAKKDGFLVLHNTNAVTGIATAATPLTVLEG